MQIYKLLVIFINEYFCFENFAFLKKNSECELLLFISFQRDLKSSNLVEVNMALITLIQILSTIIKLLTKMND